MKTIYIAGVEDIDKEYFDPISDGKIIPDYVVQKGDVKTLTSLLV